MQGTRRSGGSARFAVPCPGGLLHRREHGAGSVTARSLVAPDIPIPERRLGIGARRLEPGVLLVGRVVGDEVDDDAHAERLGVVHQLDKVSGGFEARAAVAVEVHVGGDVQVVDNGVLEPVVVYGHRDNLHKLCYAGESMAKFQFNAKLKLRRGDDALKSARARLYKIKPAEGPFPGQNGGA